MNVIAALFFPVTAIASVFGMNLASGFDETHPELFWAILIAGVVAGGVTCVFVSRPASRKKKSPG